MKSASACRSVFDAYLTRLVNNLDARREVTGLVLAGSTADRDRVDEWSDHDFLVIADNEGAAESMRSDLGWLPDCERIVLRPREGAHGLKVVYDDGHVLEFAVFAPGELSLAIANAYEVAIDRGGIAETMRDAARKPRPGHETSVRDHAELFLALLLIGVGRHRRGETLTAGQFVRSHALAHLVALHRAIVGEQPHQTALLDDLDVYRRLELVHPSFAVDAARALEHDPETAARRLLELAEGGLIAADSTWPHDGARAVRERLGWNTIRAH
ncbi:MAG: hypothetical protein Q7J04_04580 [Microcella sp.]|nr:hypothetical protein [Microcella sp.]